MKALIMITATALLLSFSACSTLDVVQKDSVRAFGEVLNTLPAAEYEPNRWKLTAPDAWLLFDNASMDMVIDAAPFIVAGLDTSQLENAVEHAVNPGTVSIYFSSPGFDMLNQNVETTALKQFEADIKMLSNYIDYHTALGHYNIDLGDGNMFEWAKDMDTNDKDIVFVLDPEPLIAAGVDPNNVEGWVFAKVTVDIDGKPAEVDKLLKPFDLK